MPRTHIPTVPFCADSAIAYSKREAGNRLEDKKASFKREYLVDCHSIQDSAVASSVSSIVRDSLSWAVDALYAYRDGLSRDERKKQVEIEERKKILYLRMRNVSAESVPLSSCFLYSFIFFNRRRHICLRNDVHIV